ncbi:MAG: hypothetical protein C4331_10650 [Meiothermus sp.]
MDNLFGEGSQGYLTYTAEFNDRFFVWPIKSTTLRLVLLLQHSSQAENLEFTFTAQPQSPL